MGGVGKTELATQYARTHEADYPGGICWLNARDTNLAAEILQFAQLHMTWEDKQQDELKRLRTLPEKVRWLWQHWQPPEGLVLYHVRLNTYTLVATRQRAEGRRKEVRSKEMITV